MQIALLISVAIFMTIPLFFKGDDSGAVGGVTLHGGCQGMGKATERYLLKYFFHLSHNLGPRLLDAQHILGL